MRALARKKDGSLRSRIVFPKFKKGGHTVRMIPVDATFGKRIPCTCIYIYLFCTKKIEATTHT